MSHAATKTSIPTPRWHWIALCLTAALTVCWGLAYGWNPLSAAGGDIQYKPEEGDLVFQSLPDGPVVRAIEGVTNSPYSHCGIVAKKGRRWFVYEALGEVRVTPLREFLARGRNGGFVVYRLRDEHSEHIPETIRCCEKYLGRPYDVRYELDDEKIYCSELIWKAYRQATNGQQLGTLRKFGEMNWEPFESLIKDIEGGEVPVGREMITPVELARARQLRPVFSRTLEAVQTSAPGQP
jgi:hypothetical protein